MAEHRNLRLPLFTSLRGYHSGWLRGDVLAGLTVWAVLVPEALAYASIAGVSPVVGLYAAPGALLLYAAFGSSRHLVVGPMSATAALSAAAVADVATPGSAGFAAHTAALALTTGVLAVAAGLLRLGFLASFISEPVLKGFIIGLALTIVAGQLPDLFGVEGAGGDFFERLWGLLADLDQTSLTTLAVGLASLALVLGLRRFAPAVPGSLVAVLGGIAAVAVLDLDAHGVAIVGQIDSGLPALGAPEVATADYLELAAAAAGVGFDRFYGFIGGETNQWYPNLVEDNHYVDQPYLPEDGYHRSKDLADKAIGYIADSKQSAPDKPWFLWFCPGANHAPHHAPKDYIDKYKGAFDDGYEAYREWVLPRMIERGVLPEGTELTPLNPLPEGQVVEADGVRPWDSLSEEEKRLFSRMAEVYAGFSEYTDAQVGRIVDYLEESGQLENTIVFYCADNGASGEGSPNGSVNENKFFNAWPDDIAENLAMLDQLGGPATYNHYPTGWAAAFSTPFRMFKRYTYQGGVCDPLVISWPAGIRARGEVRHQYHHAVDIVPTILECCGVEFPDYVLGYEQTPLPGVSMRYSFDQADAPTAKKVQYYEMMGTRGLWSEGWKVVAERGPMIGTGNFENDTWQLFHTDTDRSEAHDVADQHPDKVRQLVDLWYAEAGKYNVLPLDDRTLAELVAVQPEALIPPGGVYVYYPGTLEVPEFTAANIRGRSYKILAEVQLADPDAQGVLLAQGARFGGHALFIKDRKLWYVYNFIGIPPEQQLIADRELAVGNRVLGVEFVKERLGERHETHGTARLYVDDQVVAEGPLRTQPGHFALAGEGLSVGRDTGDAVSKEYTPQFPLTGGRIIKVEVSIGDDVYLNIEREFAAAMARD